VFFLEDVQMNKTNHILWVFLCAILPLVVGYPAYPKAASYTVTTNAFYLLLAGFANTADCKEDFETRDFSRFPWLHAADSSWTITSSEQHAGSYSAQAGNIGDSETSTLKVTLDCESGTIAFYLKVSSESGFDYLTFYIDGVEKDKWSGEDDWAEMSFPVTAGTRTFEWSYSKDSSVSDNEDTAWIDDIVFPIALTPKTAHNPAPPDGARFMNIEADLSWDAGEDAVMHDLYFGTNEGSVTNGTGGTFKGNLSTTTYDPGTLAKERTYFWRVDEFDGITTHRGDIWRFTTCPEISITTYEITASSYIGGSGDDDSVRGCGIQSDGTVVLAANISDAIPGGVEPALLNGATQSSNGAIIRLSSDGTTVLSVTRLADLLLDMALDDSDNIHVALWTQGMAKLDPTATSILWKKEQGNVNRIDAGPSGYCITLVTEEAEPDTYQNVFAPSIHNIRVYTPNGNELGNFPGYHMTFDICIDEATQTICHIGFKQCHDRVIGEPVQISYVQGVTYGGNILWTTYDWSVDPDSDRYLNKPENNMADTRGYRCCIGRDGKLYCVFECAGGNHIFRYNPFNIMSRVDIVGGDEWFEFWNTKYEHKTFIGRYEPTSGEYLLGQQFCCRLEDYRGNMARVLLGQVCADELGRVYVGGRASWGLPIPGHPRYTPALGQIAFNPLDGYLGGGFFLVLAQDFKTRSYCTRLTNSFSDHKDCTHAIAARILSGTTANIAFGGSCSTELYTKAAIQSNLQGDREGWFAVIPPTEAPSVLYVDATATGEKDGTSWVNAFTDLQDAFAAAVAIPDVEVRVAQGIYLPDRGRLVGRGDRTVTYQLINGVTFKGGYAGLGRPNPNARNVGLYKTILSGDLSGNDRGVEDPRDLSIEPTRFDNSRHVVTGSGTNETATLDGFTIVGGYADEWPKFGGGMYNDNGSPKVMNCTFKDNWSIQNGGGMCNRNISSPVLTNCIFIGNRAENKGGGVYNVGYSNPTLQNCFFTSNSAEDGGGLLNDDNSRPNVTDCTFEQNSADREGGGIYNSPNCNVVLINCLLTCNSAKFAGGMHASRGTPLLENCIFDRNSAIVWGGGLVIRNGDPTLFKCTFSENSARSAGGIRSEGDTEGTNVTNCKFIGNSATDDGGGLWISPTASPMVTNCIFNENSATHGGGVYNEGYRGEYGATPQLVNCTFSGNSASSEGGGVYAYSGSFPTLLNCILWSNTPEEIYLRSSGLIAYSDIQGGWPGQGNINADPQFVNPTGGDYHLKSQAGRWDALNQSWVIDAITSPCLDAGDPSSPVEDEPQPNGGRINMGAYGGTSEASKSIQ